jgi:hypothetical protein
VLRYQFVDFRWELGTPERGRELYRAEHIPVPASWTSTPICPRREAHVAGTPLPNSEP